MPVIAAIEGRAHVHSEYALLASVIVAAEGATFHDVPHFAGGIVPGGRNLHHLELSRRSRTSGGISAESTAGDGANGKALSRARELAELYLKAPGVTRRNTRIHFMQPLDERILRDVGYGLSLEGASAADLVKSMQAKSERVAQKGKVA